MTTTTHDTFNEEDLRPKKLMAEKRKFLEEDIQYLLDNGRDWVVVSCPAGCQSDSRDFGSKNGFNYNQCIGCEMIFTNPRPSNELLTRFYQQSKNYAFWNDYIFPASEDTRRRKIFKPRADKVKEYCSVYECATSSLIDIGAAFGTFCDEVVQLNLFDEVIALEPTEKLAATCRSRGHKTLETTIELLDNESTFDVITAFEVIEHLFSPQVFLAKCRNLLNQHGLLILSCPNHKGFDSLVLGLEAGMYDHEHLNYFSPPSLSLLLKRCGFDVLRVSTPGKLDVDLVKTALCDNTRHLHEKPLMRELICRSSETTRQSLQKFLSDNGLSSHMWIVATPQC